MTIVLFTQSALEEFLQMQIYDDGSAGSLYGPIQATCTFQNQRLQRDFAHGVKQ